ncbi:urease accessory protein UreF [Oceanobacillus sp. FSL W7-1293]|uniref:urease accessory protein UreF n=1 Tax=Oceanobacillus TaxID=182709 RepID=UPI0030D5B116
MTNSLLTFVQLCDSNFPIGGFSHSFGLETYIQEDVVKDRISFQEWLDTYFREQVKYTEGLAFQLVCDALCENDLERIWHMDRLLYVQNLPKETREGNTQMGVRMLKLAESLFEYGILANYLKRIKQGKSFGHSAIVFAVIAHYHRIQPQEGLGFYLYSLVSNLVQNAVRAIPLGQTDGQKILLESQQLINRVAEEIADLTIDDFGIVSPGLEISQMKHEHVKVRIFMS